MTDAPLAARALTEREASILSFLLEVDDPRLAPLRAQAQTASVRDEWTDGCASIDLNVDRERTRPAELGSGSGDRIVVGTRTADPSLVPPFELLLFVRDGWLQSIEIVHHGDARGVPSEFPPPSEFEPPVVTMPPHDIR